jgi:hypothetical protein
MFCAHHAREHVDKLSEIAATIEDESGTLAGDARPTTGQ